MRIRMGLFEWDDARFFLAIHREGSLSAAARKLGVNQSTMSRKLASMEERLAVKLFVRTRDRFVLAPLGERMVARAERMEEEALALERDILGQEERLTGTVRITAPDAFGTTVITPLLIELQARYPDITCELNVSNRLMSLSRREADIGIRTARSAEANVVGRAVCDFAVAPYASRDYLAARGTPRRGAYDGHDFVGFDDPLRGTLDNQWIEERAERGRIVFRSSSTPAQLAAVLAGAGIGLFGCYLGDDRPELVRLEPPMAETKRQFWLVMHKDLQHVPRFRATVDFLAEALRKNNARFAGTARGRTTLK